MDLTTVKIRPLKETWGGNERYYKVLKREGNAVLVEATNHSDVRMSFEVAWIRPGKLHPKDRREDGCDLSEQYPGNNDWGKRGWTWNREDVAEAHFRFLAAHGPKVSFPVSKEYRSLTTKKATR